MATATPQKLSVSSTTMEFASTANTAYTSGAEGRGIGCSSRPHFTPYSGDNKMTETAHISNDTTPEQESRFRPPFGLPQSLLRQEGKTLVVFALLQPMGLNRNLKRSLAESVYRFLDLLAERALGELPGNTSESVRKVFPSKNR